MSQPKLELCAWQTDQIQFSDNQPILILNN